MCRAWGAGDLGPAPFAPSSLLPSAPSREKRNNLGSSDIRSEPKKYQGGPGGLGDHRGIWQELEVPREEGRSGIPAV